MVGRISILDRSGIGSGYRFSGPGGSSRCHIHVFRWIVSRFCCWCDSSVALLPSGSEFFAEVVRSTKPGAENLGTANTRGHTSRSGLAVPGGFGLVAKESANRSRTEPWISNRSRVDDVS